MKFIFIGPSGAGKGTFAEIFKDKGIPRSISSTTRTPRKWEKEGIDYFFLEQNEKTKIKMIESPAYDDNHRDVWYFTTKDQFEKEKNIYCEMSKKGIDDLKQYYGKDNIKVIYVYCKPEEAFERIRDRNGEEYALKRNYANYKEGSFDDFELADLVIMNTNKSNMNLNKWILKSFIEFYMD